MVENVAPIGYTYDIRTRGKEALKERRSEMNLDQIQQEVDDLAVFLDEDCDVSCGCCDPDDFEDVPVSAEERAENMRIVMADRAERGY